jgi:hypothetical protein
MRNVGDPGLFPKSPTVNPRGVRQRFFELARESHICFSREPPIMEAGVAEIADSAPSGDFAGEPTSRQAP